MEAAAKNGPQIANEELTVRVCFRFGGFLHGGKKDPNVCLSSALSVVRAPAMGSCCGSLLELRICSIFFFFEELGLQSFHHYFTGRHNQKTGTLKKEASLRTLYVRALLSNSQQGSRTRSQIQSGNDQIITRIQAMNSRKFKQIPSACSYQDLYK